MRKVIVLLVFCVSPAWAQLVHVAAGSGSGFLALTVSNVTPGSFVTAEVGYYGGGTEDPLILTTQYGDSCIIINEAGWANNGHYGNSAMFYCFNMHGGSTTFTSNSIGDGEPARIDDWTGGPLYYMLDNSPPVQQFNGTSSSITMANLWASPGFGLNICYGMDGGSATDNIGFPVGYTNTGNIQGGLQTFNVGYTLTIGPSVVSNPTVSFLSSNLNAAGCASFRAILPSIGLLEESTYVNATTQTFPMPLPPGALMLATVCGATGIVTDSQSNDWDVTPGNADSDSSSFYLHEWAIDTAGGNPTITFPASCGGQLYAFQGVNAIGEVSAYFSGDVSPSIPSGTIQVPGGGAILFDWVNTINSPYPAVTYTSDPNFTYQFANGGDGLNDTLQTFVRTVYVGGAYSNSTGTTGVGRQANSILISLVQAPLNYPVIHQHARGSLTIGPDGTVTANAIAPVKNHALILSFAGTTSTCGTQSDNQGNTFTLIAGGGSLQFCLYETITTASGTYSVNNTNTQCVNLIEIPLMAPYTAILDAGNQTYNAGGATSTGTGGITTSQTDLVVAGGYLNDSTSRLYFTSLDAGWNTLALACGAHVPAIFAGFKYQTAAGSYNPTFTWGASQETGGVIAGIEVPIIAPVAANPFNLTGTAQTNGTSKAQ